MDRREENKVLIGRDLAELYNVDTKVPNQAALHYANGT